MDLELLKTKSDELLKNYGYYLYSLNTSKDKNGLTVSIIIDDINDNDISMDDIVKISNLLNDLFDELDIIQSAYTLDISSIGAEKPINIDNIDKYINKYVCIHLNHPYEGENILYGTIISVDNDEITLTYKIKTRTKEVKIRKDNILKARKAIKF